MSSPYFSFSALTKFALARAEAVNAIFQGIDVGFGKLPDPDALNQQRHNYVVAGGSANVITVSLPKAPAAYVEGLRLSVKITATTTTDATINVNGLGAKAIVRANGDPTAANDLVTGQIVDMQYDGSVFRLIAASEVLAAASAAAAAASATAAGNSASDAATSATNAHNSELAAAASATAAAAANKVAKAGDTMTGDLRINARFTINTDPATTTGYGIFVNDTTDARIGLGIGGTLAGYLQALPGLTRLSASGATELRLNTNGNDRLTVKSDGGVYVSAGIIRFSNTTGDEKGRLVGTNPYFSAYDGTETTRRGYLQWNNGGPVILASDVGGLQLVAGGITGFILDSNKDITGPRNLTIGGSMTIAGQPAATQAYVNTQIANLVATAPATLDTLNELAAALGNDANFSTTMTNALAAKAPLASPTFTGDPKAPTPTTGDNDTSIATTAFVQATLAASPTLGGTPTAATAAAGTATTQLATTAFADRLRDLPGRTVGAANALVASDRGGHVVATGAGGFAITLPSGVFGSGAVVVIINDSSGNITIARSGVVMRWAATGADADRTLAPGGMATIIRHANGSERFIISGAGLS